MKKLLKIFLSFLVIGILLISSKKVIADNTLGINQQQLNALQASVASEVSHMNLVEKRGIIGTVDSSSNTQITITDINGNLRFIDLDQLTKFSSPNNSSFGISNITKGMTLGILGIYNKTTQRILARFVSVMSLPYIFHGTISSLDHQNYVVYVDTMSQKNIYLDYEVWTKSLSYTKKTAAVKIEWAQLNPFEHVIVIATAESQKGHFEADTMILLPNIPSDPNISITIPTPIATNSSAIKKNK